MAHKLFIGDLAAAADRGKMSGPMTSLNELREQGQMTWSEDEQGWTGAPAEILAALAADGFAECKREMTRSRRDCRPVGGVWQGVNPLRACDEISEPDPIALPTGWEGSCSSSPRETKRVAA